MSRSEIYIYIDFHSLSWIWISAYFLFIANYYLTFSFVEELLRLNPLPVSCRRRRHRSSVSALMGDAAANPNTQKLETFSKYLSHFMHNKKGNQKSDWNIAWMSERILGMSAALGFGWHFSRPTLATVHTSGCRWTSAQNWCDLHAFAD